MSWERKISKRFYTFSGKQNWYSGLLSMLGMSVGCFAMVISLSVMNGFEKLVHFKLKGFNGDIRIYGDKIDERKIRNIEGVNQIIPFMERKGVVETNDYQKVVSFKAIDEKLFDEFYNFKIRGSNLNIGKIIIGQDLAYRLGKDVGDNLVLSSPLDQSFGFGIPFKKEFKISGIFMTKVLDYDDSFVFLSLDDGEKIFRRKKNIDGYDIRLKKGFKLEEVKNNLSKISNENSQVLSWEDLNKSLVSAMRIERIGTICILCLIFLVSTFNLASSLTLMSYEKIKEIGILRSMGAPIKSIIKIIIQCGFEKAGKGALTGLGFGMLIVFIQNKFSLIKIPSDIYFIQSLPMIISFLDLLLIITLSFCFILLSSYLTGEKISKTEIIKALK